MKKSEIYRQLQFCVLTCEKFTDEDKLTAISMLMTNASLEKYSEEREEAKRNESV